MEDFSKTLNSKLSVHPGKTYSLVVNGLPIIDGSHQVFVRQVEHKLEFFTRRRNRDINRHQNIPCAGSVIQSLRSSIMSDTKFANVDFIDEYDNSVCSLVLNDPFRVAFLETPKYVLIKKILSQLNAGKTLGQFYLPYSSSLTENIRNNWATIVSQFQYESVIRYGLTYERLLKISLNSKLRTNELTYLYQSELNSNRNMIHLFFETAGFTHPFNLDKSWTRPLVFDNWFFGPNNHRMFSHMGAGFSLSCMTPVSFCRSVGLDHKLEFDTLTALLLLSGLLYQGNLPALELPRKEMSGNYHVIKDPVTDEIVDVQYNTEPLTTEDGGVLNSLEFFCLLYSDRLSGKKSSGTDRRMTNTEIYKILENATITERG